MTNGRVTPETLTQLRKEVAYKWKVQTAKHWGCECVAYIDARQVMDLLDEVVGPQNWQDHYREVAGKVYCDLTLKVEDEWITKSDCGTASQFEADKGQASDAFKRAGVKWGIGRFLYQLDTVRTKSLEVGKDDRGNPRFYPADEQGQRIYNLTGYIQNLQTRKKREQPPRKNEQPAASAPLAAAPVAVQSPSPPARSKPTKSQTEQVLIIRDTLGWTAEQLGIWLRERYTVGWKQLTRDEATRALTALEAELKKLKKVSHA